MQKGKVLIVDDEIAQRSLLASIFKKAQFEIALADNKEEALQLFRLDPSSFVFVVTDYCIPKYGDGLVLLENIRIISDVPTFLITGSELKCEEFNVLKKKFNAIFYKPFVVAEFFAHINTS